MKIALIEPHLVDYTGHFYNFVTELRRGFNEIDSNDVVDVLVPKKCNIDEPFIKILPEAKNLRRRISFRLVKRGHNVHVYCMR